MLTNLTFEEINNILKLIADYYTAEFQDDGPYISEFADLSDIPLAYTTLGGNDEADIQVSLDLVNMNVVTKIVGEKGDYVYRYPTSYDVLMESGLDWGDLMYGWEDWAAEHGYCTDMYGNWRETPLSDKGEPCPWGY